MDKITDVSVTHCTDSRFVQPFRVVYKQDGKQKFWDCIKVHDSVSVLIYNKTRDSLVCVKQFRPAVYMSRHKHLVGNSPVFSTPLSQKSAPSPKSEPSSVTTPNKPSVSEYASGALGCTYEMCAGIIDKGSSLKQITKEEILEETGYDVPLESIEKVNSYYSSVGHSGSHQTFFYCEVTDSMIVSRGGGNVQEGEFIDVIYTPAKDALDMLFNEDIPKSPTLCFALLWFVHYKRDKK